MPLEQILVLVDFSESSDAAVQRAAGIAQANGAAVHLLHAYGPRGVVSEAAFAEHGQIANARLADSVEALTAGGIVASAIAHPGSPMDAFDAVEDATAPQLVVVGARGTSRLRTMLLGSVAQAVIDHAFAPVLVVRGASTKGLYQRALLASDFSGDAAAAASVVRTVADSNATIHLAHIDAIPYEAVASLGSSAIDQLRADSQRQLDAEAASLDAVAHRGSGDPAREIVKLGRELECDLIGMGYRGEGARGWLDSGSATNAVLRHTDSSVLVARRVQLHEPVDEHLDAVREETYQAQLGDNEQISLIETLREVKRLADASRELERELLHEATEELGAVASQIEREHPSLAASLSLLVRTLSRMGI